MESENSEMAAFYERFRVLDLETEVDLTVEEFYLLVQLKELEMDTDAVRARMFELEKKKVTRDGV